MTKIFVSLPSALHEWVDAQSRSGTYNDASDYIRDLIRRDRKRPAALVELQADLDEGLASGISDRSMAEVMDIARSEAKAAQGG